MNAGESAKLTGPVECVELQKLSACRVYLLNVSVADRRCVPE